MRMTTAMFKRLAAIVGLMSLLWILSTLTIPSSSHAAIFFDDSFETCVVGGGASFPCEGWNDFGQERAGVIDVVTTPTFSGSKSFQQTLNSATGIGVIAKASIYKSFPATDHVFMRWAIKWSVPFQYCLINGVSKHVRIKVNNGYPLTWIINYYGNYAVLVEGPYGGQTALYRTGVSVNSGRWDQAEFEWKLNTPGLANGLLRFWINGVLQVEALNKEWRGPFPDSVHPIYGSPTRSTATITNTQIYVQCGVGNAWYDRFAVGNTRIGLTTGQPSSDTTPPASPSGVQAR